MPLTPDQEKAVKSAREPLFIQAGAGTGKTFTLTKRIAYGLSEKSGPIIGDVDKLLTITFTNKAAGELIGRVRSELREQGLDEEALKVDAAWISTIHSMCRRMLFSHAFDMGIDPGANLLTEEDSSALSALALDDMLREKASDRRLIALFDVFGLADTAKLISELSSILELSPNGAKDFSLGPEALDVKAARQKLTALLVLHMSALADLDSSGIPHEKKTYEGNYQAISENIDILNTIIDGITEEVGLEELSQQLASCKIPRGGNFKDPFKEIFAKCREELLELEAQIHASVLHGLLMGALELAEEHLMRHRAFKRFKGALDTNDLLIEAYLMLKSHPSIAAQYRDQFDSIMVDEFQDTDTLQVGIVEQISREGLTSLATVGDAQQSIYGFRGADLEVYQEMRSSMSAHGSKEVELTVNYRSQPDILRFVEDVFSTPMFFGPNFLKVTSGRSIDTDPRWLSPVEPRVKIIFSAGVKSEELGRKTNVKELRQADAIAVADEFERLHRQGARYGDMAILMRSTKETYAGAYLRELRKRGIPCVISGGSDFFSLPEVFILSMLLRFFADQDDDEAVFGLLGSAMFNLSDDDLLELSIIVRHKLHLVPDEARSKPSLFDGMRYRVYEEEDPSDELVSALRVLENALRSLESSTLSEAVREAVKFSGWEESLRKQGTEGGACYANIVRFCDMIDDHEDLYGYAPFEASEYFRNMIKLASEGSGARAKPGSLVSSGKDAVSIMTIHSSKGLEFPIVAVAEFEGSSRLFSSGLISNTEIGKRYLSLGLNASGPLKEHLMKKSSEMDSFSDAFDAAMHLAYATALQQDRDYEELQRLFYVALTRARDKLVIVMHDNSYASSHELAEGLTKDSLEAVFGSNIPTASAQLVTGAKAKVDFSLTVVEPLESSDEGGEEKIEELLHSYPAWEEPERISAHFEAPRKLFSYSSIVKRSNAANFGSDLPASALQLRDRELDTETANTVGSAFHLLAQRLALANWDTSKLAAFYDAVSLRYALSENERRRLQEAVESWLASKRYEQVLQYPQHFAEYPFCVDVEGVSLEGFVDLLCLDDEGPALVIDYKTGTSGRGEDLHDRYALQAHCYAYALLSSGVCKSLEMVFVRPEADMEEVTFGFAEDDVSMLEKLILGA